MPSGFRFASVGCGALGLWGSSGRVTVPLRIALCVWMKKVKSSIQLFIQLLCVVNGSIFVGLCCIGVEHWRSIGGVEKTASAQSSVEVWRRVSASEMAARGKSVATSEEGRRERER
jgi:hypothetical protein